ncbi:restriction endonuclease subunit S [Geminocystis herdmanii]|uniref:restriction endonuclease subunit S n=1 Tax=Geminocystis herdmanii TaxID=669359 RepID=UPI000376D57E|nr:restriction endonuclease subunit S [Geminocystis herdmanii]
MTKLSLWGTKIFMTISKSKTATIELLDQYFTTAFSAPEGIPKLRELILSLAMQGQLVPQNPDDKPARELLKDIQAEKQRLIKEGKLKKSDPLPEITPDEIPYDIPDTWEWVRLGDMGNIFNGNSINSKIKETKYRDIIGLPYIATKDVGYGFEKVDYENGIFIPKNEDKFKIAHNGSILICSEGGSAGKKCGLIDRDICFGNKLFANEPFAKISSKFILCIYLTPFFKVLFTNSMTGIIGGISINKFIKLLIPLPPLEEQKRIVERIESLMDKCDRLQDFHQQREAIRLKMQLAVGDKLLNAPDKQTFNEAWQFMANNFETLYSVKENVKELRKVILQLAVMGKLVPQDTRDRSARELLRDIEAEKQRLIKEGKIKPQKPLPAITPDEIPYDIPDTWEWVRVINVVDVGTGSTPTKSNSEYYNGTIPWYTSSATNNLFAEKPNIFITDKAIQETNCKVFPTGSLIVALYGQGKTRGQISEIIISGATNQAIAAMIFFESSKGIKKYLKYYFLKIYDEIRSLAEGGAQPNLNIGKIKNIPIPLPPLEEQKRIVEKVDKMMKLCDELEEKITAQTDTQTRLLYSTIAQILP